MWERIRRFARRWAALALSAIAVLAGAWHYFQKVRHATKAQNAAYETADQAAKGAADKAHKKREKIRTETEAARRSGDKAEERIQRIREATEDGKDPIADIWDRSRDPR